ncbi:MAG: polymer-forming cytoskeletal protein [Longimicrobiales bacterium]
MAKERTDGTPPEAVISIIGPGMHVVGDCVTTGSLRIEGQVQGAVRAGKAVVVAKDGFVDGDIETQDAVISGRVVGSLKVGSRLELQAGCRIEGTVQARRMQLEEGATLEGQVQVGEEQQAPARSDRPMADGDGPKVQGRQVHGPKLPLEASGSQDFSTVQGKLSKPM